MKRLRKTLLVIVAGLLVLPWSSLYAQFVTQDWDLHDVGSVIQIVTNRGKFNKAGTDYPGLINTEYPLNSHQEHLGDSGWYIGGITPEGDTLVSVTNSFGSPDEFPGYSSAIWDTVWAIYPGDTLDIGGDGEIYLPEYTAVSDQDLVSRYNDYNEASLQLTEHYPLYLDVIQTSYAWSSPPLDKIIIYNIQVVPTQTDINQVYLANFVDGMVGSRTGAGFTFSEDDRVQFYNSYKMAVYYDWPGGPDNGEYTPIGMMLIPSEETVNQSDLSWTWLYSPSRTPVLPPGRDPDRYLQMRSGRIQENMETPGRPHHLLSYGPMELTVGDTFSFRIAEILGDDEEEILENAELAEWLIDQDFKVPSPPPSPPLTVESQSHTITLNWEPTAEVNPEEYVDPNRADSATKPFEGYRVYKSTQSVAGPWTLLAEYDLPDNTFGLNTGLKHQFTDTGLLNNVEYYYTVTAFSKPDTVSQFPSQESSLNATAGTVVPGTAPPEEVGKVAVVPNPYRGDIDYNAYNPPWEKPPRTRERWMEQDRRIQFINLPAHCVIRVYTLSGDLITTIRHDDPNRGYEDWNLTSDVGQAISSGIYVFTVEETGADSGGGDRQVGKFVVIK